MSIIYVPRCFGGTIILIIGSTPPPSGVAFVQASARDGIVIARGR